MHRPAPNLIANPSAEQSVNGMPAGWRHDSWGVNATHFSYVNEGHARSRSLKTSMTSCSSGAAKWYFDPVPVTAGRSYLFAAWLKTDTQPRVTVCYQMRDGSARYERAPAPLVTASAATAWQKYSTTITVPAGAQRATVFIAISSAGWVQTSDYSLTACTPTGFRAPLVSLTFDDGLLSAYTNALPLLRKFGLVSTAYLVSGKIGAASRMTAGQIREFQRAGSEIASHTGNHPDLTMLSHSQLAAELSQSQATLRRLFGDSAAADFASPYGQYNHSVLASARRYYRSHRSADAGFNSQDALDPFAIKVQNVSSATTTAQVADWVSHAIASRTWLVLVYHAVEDQVPAGDRYAVATADLSTALAQIKASGVRVVTVGAALDELIPQLLAP